MDEALFARENWIWALSLIAVTIAIHVVGVVMMALVMVRLRLWVERQGLGLWCEVPIVIGTIATIGLLLAVLHGTEMAIWAAAYLWLGAFGALTDAMLYSVGAMTTAGAPGLSLEGHWRMMGALESAGGMLLFGISTAHIFAALQARWPMLSRRHSRHPSGGRRQ